MALTPIRADLGAVRREVESEFGCSTHSEGELRRRVLSNLSERYSSQCLTCGVEIPGTVIKKNTLTTDQLHALEDWDDELAARFNNVIETVYQQRKEEAEAKAFQDWLRQHDAYLETKEWKNRSRLTILRAQGICEGCRTSPATQAHHMTYRHWGEEFIFEMVALCEPCHERFHGEMLQSFAPSKAVSYSRHPK